MSLDTTENDAEIARILAEEYQSINSKRLRSSSPARSKKFKTDDIGQTRNNPSSIQENENCLQIDEDAEMAFILQIEEIILSENHINEKTVKVTDTQLVKTHADMTKALQPTEQSDFMARVLGMFVTIQTRYVNYQAKNQELTNQIQKLSIQLYPALIPLRTPGIIGIPGTAVPSLAIGLITNVLQGRLEFNDAKQIMFNMLQIWNESNVWYEFFEQLVYILVAITIPSFAQGAMGKIMEKISSSK